jgi:hypothetical protein
MIACNHVFVRTKITPRVIPLPRNYAIVPYIRDVTAEPLLFFLYINDLPDCLRQVSPRLFADDTNLTVAGETIEEVELAMNNDLLRIKEWLLANKLSLNVAKTEFLLIGSHHKLNNLDSKPSVNIGHDSIKQVQHNTVLGVEIDENLSWKKHIENVVKKVTSGIYWSYAKNP